MTSLVSSTRPGVEDVEAEEEEAHVDVEETAEDVEAEEEEFDEEEEAPSEDHDHDEMNEAPDVAQDFAMTSGSEINVASFDLLVMDERQAEGVQALWRNFIESCQSREAAGEAIYAAFFESLTSVQSYFTSPRAVAAMRFMTGLNSFVTALMDPPRLKILVETVGFGHLNYDMTVPRVCIVRDALLDLFQVELGQLLTTEGLTGWRSLLNYIGGAMIFIKQSYSERIRILDESWAIANDKNATGNVSGTMGSKEDKHEDAEAGEGKTAGKNGFLQSIPTNFNEMFKFNAAVMGFGTSLWMHEILEVFDNIVRNMANSNRVAEECDFLVLRISRTASGKVNLNEFKSCMLASLRSLLPKDWSTAHEVAWSWLWENVERMLLMHMGKPGPWELALTRFFDSQDEDARWQFRANVYSKFFTACPAGQDFFKQSNTYLHLISTKVLKMTVDLYKDPTQATDDISAIGLRHVGYGIPTEYFGPFATANIEVLTTYCKDELVIDSFRWSLGLISKSVVRTIMEGSTIVMKAINVDTRKAMLKAISCAPRGDRSSWMLMVRVGTAVISPLAWAIEAGSLEAAATMLQDLLTIRADRDRYYYGAEEMFQRHPNIVKMLIDNAPALLPDLFDGLIWRSRLTKSGQRRVNYYIKHLLVSPEGKFHKTLDWITEFRDPRLVCHQTLVFLANIIWERVALRQFLYRKSSFILTVILFMCSQSVLQHLHENEYDDDGFHKDTEYERIMRLVFRALIYACSLGVMVVSHIKKGYRQIRAHELYAVHKKYLKIPNYLLDWQEALNLVLVVTLFGMLCTEPILYCMSDNRGYLFTDECDTSYPVLFPYSVLSMVALLLYFVLLLDMAVFSNAVTAYALVCGRMLSELGLFLFLGSGVLLMFSSSLSCLHQPIDIFHGIPGGMIKLFEMFIEMFSKHEYEHFHDEIIVSIAVVCFLICFCVFLGNMLVAQLSCAYRTIYNDMVGYARLQRISIITDCMPYVTKARWNRFVSGLHLDDKIEFNDGDLGLAGGVTTMEPSTFHPTTYDSIKRFGGSTSPSMQWPAEDGDMESDDSDKLMRLEKLIQTVLTRVAKGGGRRGRHVGNTSSAMSGGSGEATRSGGDKDSSQTSGVDESGGEDEGDE